MIRIPESGAIDFPQYVVQSESDLESWSGRRRYVDSSNTDELLENRSTDSSAGPTIDRNLPDNLDRQSESNSFVNEEKFNQLRDEWEQATAFISSVSEMVLHPAYQRIIGMGSDVLPFLFWELERSPNYWFWALKAITGEDPVSDDSAGNIEEMTQQWLNWAQVHGLIF